MGESGLDEQAPTCVITGANAGIGFHTALGMAKRGYRVVMVSRNADRGQAAAEKVRQQTGRGDVELVVGDLGSNASVNALADALIATCPVIDVLINNAGAWLTKRYENEDGYEQTLATNHLGPFLLTLRLIDQVKAAEQGRILNLSSALHRRGVVDFDDLHTTTRSYSGIQAYGDSKLMNIMFTRALARRLEAQGSTVTTNAVHPGRVYTEITKKGEGFIGGLARLLTPVVRPLLKSPEQGAATSIHVATHAEGQTHNGDYFADEAPLAPKPRATNDDIGEKLWTVSEELVGYRWP